MPKDWYPAAVVKLGPDWKTGSGAGWTRDGQGAVVHSAEGYAEGILSVLMGKAFVSWHFSVLKDGTVWQHYPLDRWTWHAGGVANARYVGIECEGVAGEPLERDQLFALVQLLHWIANKDGWTGYQRGTTLFEHNEFMATACPSGRIPWDTIIPILESLAGSPPASALPSPESESGGTPAPDAPSIDAQLDALQAAAAVLWVHHSYDQLPDWDRQVIKQIASRL